MKRYKVEFLLFDVPIDTFVIDAINEVNAFIKADAQHKELAEDVTDWCTSPEYTIRIGVI